MVDDLLGAPFNFRVAALNRVKVQLGGVGAAGHGAGRPAAHANPHAWSAQLNQQGAGGKFNFVGELAVDHAQATGNHDGLVVATRHTRHLLFVLAEIAQQVGPSELVVERSAAQGALGHDLQRAGHVGRPTQGAVPQFGHREARHPRFGFGAASCGALVPNFTASARGSARKRRYRGGMVVGFHLHQHMVGGGLRCVARQAGTIVDGHKALYLMAFHDGGIV